MRNQMPEAVDDAEEHQPREEEKAADDEAVRGDAKDASAGELAVVLVTFLQLPRSSVGASGVA